MGTPSLASPLRNCGRSSKKFNDSHSSYRHIPRKVQTNVRFNSHKNPQSSLFIAAQSRGPCSQELVNTATRIHLCATFYRSSGVALVYLRNLNAWANSDTPNTAGYRLHGIVSPASGGKRPTVASARTRQRMD